MKNTLQALFLFSFSFFQAQTFTIKGLVTDENNNSIYGINILVKNTNIETTTDF